MLESQRRIPPVSGIQRRLLLEFGLYPKITAEFTARIAYEKCDHTSNRDSGRGETAPGMMRLQYRRDSSDVPFFLKNAMGMVKTRNTFGVGFISRSARGRSSRLTLATRSRAAARRVAWT